jgi:GR25 family glycosyltransferase involved in LPS biosynthesis
VKAFVIYVPGHRYSEACAERCIKSAFQPVEKFAAVPAWTMEAQGLRWTWGEGGAGLKHHPYGGGDARISCAMSHQELWAICALMNEPILILEHDAVFLRPLPDIEFESICQVNDPDGATRKGAEWSARMKQRGPGIFPASWVTDPKDCIPDGLAGNSAYMIKPHAAERLLHLYRELGVWPNDATMCKQLVRGMQELYPFVTRVEQTVSTTNA